ncbi:hypothetical protein [Lysobacter gummosus]|uniref:hypothetical protein n=1 Tax=Lysobacter gummosus TaxID=262324 RepID=UPI00362E6EE1
MIPRSNRSPATARPHMPREPALGLAAHPPRPALSAASTSTLNPFPQKNGYPNTPGYPFMTID